MEKGQIFSGMTKEGKEVFFSAQDADITAVTGGSPSERRELIFRMAENMSRGQTAVFISDTSGHFTALAGENPVTLWDLYGKSGLPLRTTATEFGPALLSALLGITEKQGDLLRVIFKMADDNGLLLIDTKDLKALINELMENADAYKKDYGSLNRSSLSAILSAVVSLETKGAEDYLFEPAIDVRDLMSTDEEGLGRINILDASAQGSEGALYPLFTLYLLAELYENLPFEETDTGLLFIIDDAKAFFKALPALVKPQALQVLAGLSEKGVYVLLSAPDESFLLEIPENCSVQSFKVLGKGSVLAADGDKDETGQVLSFETSDEAIKPLGEKEREILTAADPLHEKYKIPFERDSAYEFLKRRGISEDDAADGGAAAPGGSSEEPQSGQEGGTDAEVASGGQQAEEDGSSKNEDLEAIAKRAKSSARSLSSTVAGTVGRQIGKSIGSQIGDFGETLGGNIGASLGRGIVNTLFKS